MKRDIEHLIEAIQNVKPGNKHGLSPMYFMSAINRTIPIGVAEIGKLLEAFQGYVAKLRPELTDEQVRCRAYEEIVPFVVCADHLDTLFVESSKNYEEHLLDTSTYGEATKALASYFGKEGKDLYYLLLNREMIVN